MLDIDSYNLQRLCVRKSFCLIVRFIESFFYSFDDSSVSVKMLFYTLVNSLTSESQNCIFSANSK